MESIRDIKAAFDAIDGDYGSFIDNYSSDERSGVQALVKRAKSLADKLEKEKERTELMLSYEKEYGDCRAICGIDEVGRGPLAGPVVAGAVILPKDERILYLNDSKQLTAAKRDELYDVIYTLLSDCPNASCDMIYSALKNTYPNLSWDDARASYYEVKYDMKKYFQMSC